MKSNNLLSLYLINFCLHIMSMSYDAPKLIVEVKNAIKDACSKKYKEKTAESLLAEVIVEEFIDNDRNNLNARDENKATLLIYSVINGPLSIIEYLINKKVDINAQDSNGWTALMHAAALKRINVVNLLMKYNSDITKKNNDNETVFDLIHYEHKSSE